MRVDRNALVDRGGARFEEGEILAIPLRHQLIAALRQQNADLLALVSESPEDRHALKLAVNDLAAAIHKVQALQHSKEAPASCHRRSAQRQQSGDHTNIT